VKDQKGLQINLSLQLLDGTSKYPAAQIRSSIERDTNIFLPLFYARGSKQKPWFFSGSKQKPCFFSGSIQKTCCEFQQPEISDRQRQTNYS
jgi:hypothetical protein